MKTRLKSDRTVNRLAARSPDVEAALGDIAYQVTLRARELLAEHRKTGVHKITQTKGDVDHYINLVGPSATALEHGHHLTNTRTTTHDGITVVWTGSTGEWVDGLHILGRALGVV